jgi:hypothetical protein
MIRTRQTARLQHFALVALVALGASVVLAGVVQAAPPRFFVVVRGVDEAAGVKSDLVEEAKALFIAELGRRPELTLTPPAELGPSAATLPSDPEAFKAALRTHKLRALELTLRILEVTRATDPPPPGKPFRVLKRGIKLSVFGTTLPDKVMAIGGDGDSLIAADIRRDENAEKEGKELLAEAAKVAITQAVDMTVTKLTLPPAKEKKPAKKKK